VLPEGPNPGWLVGPLPVYSPPWSFPSRDVVNGGNDPTYDADLVDDSQRMVADRTALRALVDAYARHVDRGEPESVAALFTADGRLVSRLHGAGDDPIVRRGRDEIAAALGAGLDRYVTTTHIVGGQVVTIDGDRATGDTVCLAHHLYDSAGTRRMLVMAVRYADTFSRQPAGWEFAERQLRLDWRQDRPLEDRQ
jgi:uncharacterized protein (TIGR02246 family)